MAQCTDLTIILWLVVEMTVIEYGLGEFYSLEIKNKFNLQQINGTYMFTRLSWILN